MEKKKSAMDVFKEQQTKAMEEESFQDNDISPNEMVQQSSAPALQTNVNVYDRAKKEKMKAKKINALPINMIKTSEELQLEKEPIRVRLTGRLFWKRVVVPPNAYVVHTRINKKEPVTIGLGISFRYKPNKDAYLIVPAAMQTIGVFANCISKEKQGINILAYVQWQIEDFAIAYKKLDFSDSRDPLGIVNAQLREQAEAAIKDKIATMSVEEVLTDKAPIIEELTSRLKQVAEGQSQGTKTIAEGLGIKIATVQIREAIVCSTSLWEDLQSPFRHEQKKKASISYIEMQNDMNEKELVSRKQKETREAETNLEIELTKQKKLTETIELKMNEEAVRYKKEQEVIQNKLKMEEQTVLSQKEMQDRLLEKENAINQKRELEILKQNEIRVLEEERIAFEANKRKLNLEIEQKLFEANEDARLKESTYQIKINQLKFEKELLINENDIQTLQQTNMDKLEKIKLLENLSREEATQKMKNYFEEEKNRIEMLYQEHYMKLEKMKQEIRNIMSTNDIFSQLIQGLPDIAAKMPQIKELKIFQSNQSEPVLDSLVNFINKIFMLSESLGIKVPFKKEGEEGKEVKKGK